MKIPIRNTALYAMLAAAALVHPAAESAAKGSGRDLVDSIIVDSLARRYELHLPAGYDGRRRMPLVIVLHGLGMTGTVMRQNTNFNEIADARSFMVAFPDSFGPLWNDGRVDIHSPACAGGIDDVTFIGVMIDRIARRHPVDRGRVYATGFSNGGMMAFRLGIAMPERLAAIATVAAALPRDLAASPRRAPLSVLIVHGTNDTTVPWAGGELKEGGKKRGEVLSVLNTVLFWSTWNSCGRRAAVTLLPDGDARDGMVVFRVGYRCAPPGTDTMLLAIQGGGHIWPMKRYSRARPRPKMMTGDLDVTEYICDFFLRHRRR